MAYNRLLRHTLCRKIEILVARILMRKIVNEKSFHKMKIDRILTTIVRNLTTYKIF